jgi:hypothetical protein
VQVPQLLGTYWTMDGHLSDANPVSLSIFEGSFSVAEVLLLLLSQSKHKYWVAVALTVLYIFLQTFLIPGSIFINLLAGSLYNFYKALAFCTVSVV